VTAAAGILVSDDLIFTSRITATARASGLSVVQARSQAVASEKARANPPACVIVDLHNPGLDLPTFLTELREACPAMPRVIGYGSHVETEVLKAARKAGCDRVMPRSQFVQELEMGLREWVSAV
jgi:CheY-like chemotaxis protein